jgi:casein kinase II subunit alpha
MFRKIGARSGKVIIKTATKERFENERDVLRHFRNRPHIRQLVDETRDPPSLVLQYFNDNLLDVSNKKTLQSSEVKFVAKRVLQALQALHEDGYTHNGSARDPYIVFDRVTNNCTCRYQI